MKAGEDPMQMKRGRLILVISFRAIISECMASFLYVFIVCGAAAGAGIGASVSSVLLTTSLASGLSIAVLTHCFIHISGKKRKEILESPRTRLPSVSDLNL